MEEAIAHLRQLAAERFYGSVTVKFEAGKVVCMKKEETIKPGNHRNSRGHANESKRDS